MSYTIEPVADSDYILVTVHGVINRVLGMEIVLAANVLGRELNIKKYFMDMTDAVNDDSTLDQYQFANEDMMETEGVDRYAQVSILVDPADHSHDFIETVCQNVGMNLRIFRKREEAMGFLGTERPSRSQRA